VPNSFVPRSSRFLWPVASLLVSLFVFSPSALTPHLIFSALSSAHSRTFLRFVCVLFPPPRVAVKLTRFLVVLYFMAPRKPTGKGKGRATADPDTSASGAAGSRGAGGSSRPLRGLTLTPPPANEPAGSGVSPPAPGGDSSTAPVSRPPPRSTSASRPPRPPPPADPSRPARLRWSCCLRCSKHYGRRPGLRCRRPRPLLKCTYCTLQKKPCLPVSFPSPFSCLRG
jgi:hypothetical protein